jgi:hypothetical protein
MENNMNNSMTNNFYDNYEIEKDGTIISVELHIGFNVEGEHIPAKISHDPDHSHPAEYAELDIEDCSYWKVMGEKSRSDIPTWLWRLIKDDTDFINSVEDDVEKYADTVGLI